MKREAVKNDTALKLADFMEDIYGEITPGILEYFFDYCMKKVYGDSDSIVRRTQENYWSLGLDADRRIGKDLDKVRKYLVNIRSSRLVFKATLDRWLAMEGNAIFQDVFLAQIIRHEKRLENDRVQLLSPIDVLNLSREQYINKSDPVKYQKNIQFKLQLPRSNNTASGLSKPIHPEFGNSVIGKLVDQPLIFSIHDPSIATSNDSLLELVSHRMIEKGISAKSFFEYLHPEYWRDVFGLSVSCKSNVIEFVHELNRLSKNSNDQQSDLIKGLIYFEFLALDYLERLIASGSSGFTGFDFMCGLTEHFIQSDYENPHAWSERYEMHILKRGERSRYANFIGFILKILTHKVACSEQREKVMSLLCQYEHKFEADSVENEDARSICAGVSDYIKGFPNGWF